MILSDKHYDTIFDILEGMDFYRIKKTMDFLQWYWATDRGFVIPDVYEIKKSARTILINSVVGAISSPNKEYVINTGGFRAESKIYKDGFLWLRLSFSIEEMDNSI